MNSRIPIDFFDAPLFFVVTIFFILLWITAFAGLGIAWIVLALKPQGAPKIFAGRIPTGFWTPFDVIMVLILALAAWLAAGLFQMFSEIMALFPTPDDTLAWSLLFSQLCLLLLFFAAFAYDRGWGKILPVLFPRKSTALAAGGAVLGLLAAMIPLKTLELINRVVYLAVEKIQTVPLQPPVELFLKTGSVRILVMLAIMAVVLAPVLEEFLFRGVLYTGLKKHLGTVPSLALVSLLFALIHPHPFLTILPLFALGVVLIMIYEWSGSLLAPIVMHACFNGTFFIIALSLRQYPDVLWKIVNP